MNEMEQNYCEQINMITRLFMYRTFPITDPFILPKLYNCLIKPNVNYNQTVSALIRSTIFWVEPTCPI